MELLDDLGWVDNDPRERFELTLEHERLARVLRDLLNHSSGLLAIEAMSDRDLAERAALTIRTCQDALRSLAS